MSATELTQLIQFRCVRPEHLRANALDRVFVHGLEWAYCPAGQRADGHTFVPTGGLDRRRLEGGVRQGRAS